MSVRSQIVGLVDEATGLLREAAESLREEECLSKRGQDDVARSLRRFKEVGDDVLAAWFDRITGEARESTGS